MTPAVTLLADAGEGAGLGHVARCSAIAAALRARGVTASCLALGGEAPAVDGVAWTPAGALADVEPRHGHAVLVDSYRTGVGDVEAFAARHAVAVLHDQGEPPAGARLVIAVGGAPEVVAAPCRVVAGLAYAPLRAPFWDVPPRIVRDAVARV
ncbi:MAG TPA: hypothetical protein VN213_13480, partial [Solirubrobacteraceae bacterium]|nr:hypothetical protein [Solirubrobacteraceae bacterium]